MLLELKHIGALDEAQTLIAHRDFCPYLELKELLPDSSALARHRFRSLFTDYYGLNIGGLTDDFKRRFFEILFAGKVIVNDKPDFSCILGELSTFERKKGDHAMPFSFVSKLVAIHCESSPIYDKHVLAFFGKKAPPASVDNAQRIEWYVGFLDSVRANYEAWARDPKIAGILGRLKGHDARLSKCDVVRQMDFLVWKVGNQKLL